MEGFAPLRLCARKILLRVIRAIRGKPILLCLISLDDDAFTYNDKENPISPIQEHAMTMRAINHGVTARRRRHFAR